MHFLVVTNGVAQRLVANCDNKDDAVDVCRYHGIIGTLIPVTLSQKIPKHFKACVFGADVARLSLLSRISLRFRGISIQQSQ